MSKIVLRKFFLIAAALFSVVAVKAAGDTAGTEAYTTEVEVLGGEKWWGLNSYFKQPFAADSRIMAGGAMTTKSLVSSAGRYISMPDMVEVAFDGKKITIKSEARSVEIEKAGKSLREAYIVCALKNFPPDKVTPDPDLFALPAYYIRQEFNNGCFLLGEEEITGYAKRLLEEGFPAGIIVIGDQWQKVNGPYEFDSDIFPDPKRMVDRLHSMGFKVMLTVSPYVPAWGRVYGEARKNGQLVQTGQELLSSRWPTVTDRGMLDMANAGQFERIRTGLDAIRREAGFDGYVFDCGDAPLASEEFGGNMMSLGQGIGMAIYNGGESKQYAPYVSSITSYAREFEYKGLEHLIGYATSLGLSGYPYVQVVEMKMKYDLESGKASERFMADYLLLQCGMPVVTVAVVPWEITDPKLYEGVKDAVNFRASIGDYMRQLVAESGKTGEPLVRHMEYQFPRQGFADCTDQFMLGPKYLFAPCVDGGDKRIVRFPKGVWVDRAGNKVKGPVVKEAECSDGRLNVYEFTR